MMCRQMWPFLLMYESHDMRHTCFPQADSGQRDPRDLGHHSEPIFHNIYLILKKLIDDVSPYDWSQKRYLKENIK